VTPDQAPPAQPNPPAWLLDLAEALAAMPVPPMLSPPPSGAGRQSAILILFAPSAPGQPEPDQRDPGQHGASQHGASQRGASQHGAEPADDPDLLLIQRSTGLRRHSGQAAFPGGAIDPADAGPVEAALREAEEEVGLDPSGVDVVGVAPELFISRSGFRVIPVLGWWRSPVPVAPADTAEVAAVARVRVRELADPANRLTVRHPSGFAGPAFRVRGMLVWGFTAALVDVLISLGGWERPWDRDTIEDLPPQTVAADPG
jgi:8-oxo-dGTP pyrophosphatase MutT (NUDIX family)